MKSNWKEVAQALCTLGHHKIILKTAVAQLKKESTAYSDYYSVNYHIISICYCKMHADAYLEYAVKDVWKVFIDVEGESH